MKHCFLNGKIVPAEDAGISVYDLGVLRGYGAFEFIRTFGGKPFHLQDHLDRLENSLREINLWLPIERTKIEQAILELLQKNGFAESIIRVIITGGKTPYNFKAENPTVFILVDEFESLPAEFYTKGIKLITYDNQRVFAEAKSLNYLPAVALQKDCDEQGAYEALYVRDGKILEARTSNFFLVKDKKVVTAGERVLPGITRQIVLDLVKGKYEVELREVAVEELQTADEAFLTASNKNVLPVTQVDEQKIGDGQVGEVTKDLMHMFDEYTEK